MDNQKSDIDVKRSEQPSPHTLPLGMGRPLIGSWTIEENPPYGFVIRNVDPASTETEYHFSYDSNGWFTACAKGEPKGIFGVHGAISGKPILVDRESTQKKERILDLRTQEGQLTEAECRELLELAGLVKRKD